jgi:hypothetical protein
MGARTKMNEHEKHFAEVFFGENRNWFFHPKTFVLNGMRYTPDFYDVNRNTYIEVVGTRQAYHQNKAKYELIRILYPDVSLEIRNYTGEIYTPKYSSNSSFRTSLKIKRFPNTQYPIAKTIGISQSALSMILNGKRGIGAGVALKMAKCTGRDVAFFLTSAPEQIVEELSQIGR